MMGGMATATRPISIAALRKLIVAPCHPAACGLALSSAKPQVAQTARLFHAALTSREVDAQRPIDGLIGAQHVIIDLRLAGLVAELLAERLEVLLILLAQPLRIDEQLVARHFEVAEL